MSHFYKLYLWLLIGLIPIIAVATDLTHPTADPALENRLTVVRTYKVRVGDTLTDVAYLLYGHKSWWPKFKEDNPQVSQFKPGELLPPGLQLRYHSPPIGKSYIVQPNDWLIRIVQWKYGDTEYWDSIYKENKNTISNPNLIHPGDRLVLELNGTVKEESTGKVLVRGVPQEPQRALSSISESSTLGGAAVSGMSSQEPLRMDSTHMDSSLLRTQEHVTGSRFFQLLSEIPISYVIGGFITGILLLLMIPLVLWFHRRYFMYSNKILTGVSLKSKDKRDSKGNVVKFKKIKEVSTLKEFRNQPAQILPFDRSLIFRDEGEVDRKMSYHMMSAIADKKKRFKIK